jgi:hypothetical protein
MKWPDIKEEIARLTLPHDQRSNALDFIFAAEDGPPPQAVSVNRYDNGLSLHWTDVGSELAVYGDHYETYRFGDGETTIRHWQHEPGKLIDPAFLIELFSR